MNDARSFRSAAGTIGEVVGPQARLSVEIRIVCAIATCWVMNVVLLLGWSVVGLPEHVVESAPGWSLALVWSLGLALVCGQTIVRLPTVRWPRSGSHTSAPSIAPLAVLGFPGLVFAPLLAGRHRRAIERSSQPEEVELAFRQLLTVPMTVAGSFLIWATAAGVAQAAVLALDTRLGRFETIALGLLPLAIAAPFAGFLLTAVQRMLRPEVLTAPRANLEAFPHQRDLRIGMLLPSGLAALGAVLGPVLVAILFTSGTAEREARQKARESTAELAQLAQRRDTERIGRFLVEHPDHSLLLAGAPYGAKLDPVPGNEGWVDRDGDETADLFVRSGADFVAAAPLVRRPAPPSAVLFQTLAAAGLLILVALWLVGRDLARDVVRASEQVEAVATGNLPTALPEASFSTRELRQLVLSVDRLVARITETNVAKYVVIEKAQEADRLKSQFLANMSHDLRSPLNSILGFSELLTTGIDGKLDAEKQKFIDTIHSSGRFLLQQIDDILDTAKLDAGRMELHPEPTPIATLLSRATEKARKRQQDRIRYDTRTAAGLPAAYVDPYRTVQAIENVLVFASERMKSGRIGIEAMPGLVDGERAILVTVATPIAPASAEQLASVLRGFVRIPGHHGLGLGLPIAGSILELQAGSLSVEETPPSADSEGAWGMEFTVSLPAPQARRRLRLRERNAD